MGNIILDYILNNLGVLITAIVVGGAGVYVSKAMKPIKEVKDLLEKTVEIFQDGRVSNEEVQEWIKEAKDIKKAIEDIKK